ncbi:hypothetical protein [Luteolibacter sp. LG18]|uniref:hypothetical protein n=1 Tax=Luteolibacter sp. LG18 TaxID=2819286 RepID=UPI0030C6BC18
MKFRAWCSLSVFAAGLLLASCGKKEKPAPVEAKPAEVAKTEAPPKPRLDEPVVAAQPADEDMPDEEEPSVPDNEATPPPSEPVPPAPAQETPAPAPQNGKVKKKAK